MTITTDHPAVSIERHDTPDHPGAVVVVTMDDGRANALATDLGRALIDVVDQIDADEDRIVRQAIEEIRRHPETVAQEVDLILIAKNLERVADHATNIAEDVVLIAEAENLKHAEKLATGVETVTPR